jgi:hypothetical protein
MEAVHNQECSRDVDKIYVAREHRLRIGFHERTSYALKRTLSPDGGDLDVPQRASKPDNVVLGRLL